MAVLHNDAKNLRLFVELVDREVPAVVPGQPAPAASQVRVLGTAGVEFFDRRDQSFWPFIRLPVVYFGGDDGPSLVRSLRDVCSLKTPGFVFRSGAQDELAVHVSPLPLGEGKGEGRGFLIEVGIDLAAYLFETSGLSGEPGRELALFRFSASTAELVRFADQLKQELQQLPPLEGS
ncbi:MAG: hypothetical protein ACOZIN_17300 [Myxococcota bacterium]